MLNDPDDSAMSTLNLALETAVYTQRIIAKHPALFIFWEIITFRSVRHDFSDLKKKFAFVEALVLTTFFPDARQIVQRVEKHVLGTKADEALVLRKSISEDCTMLAVAVSLLHLFSPKRKLVLTAPLGGYCGSSCDYSSRSRET